MMTFLTSKVLSYIGGGVALIAVLALIYVKISSGAEISALEKRAIVRDKEISTLSRDLTTARNNSDLLSSSIEKQMERAKAEADKLIARTAAQDEAYNRQVAALAMTKSKLARLMATKPGVDPCADANALIEESLK